MQCRKKVLLALYNCFNFVLSFLGLGLIAISVYELNNSISGTIERTAIVVQIFIGSFIILTTFLGCFSSCRSSNSGLIWSYVFCMVILTLFQIYILIAANTTDYVQKAADNYTKLWQNSTLNFKEIAYYEQKFKCCGLKSPRDYVDLNQAIPRNCYNEYDRVASNLFVTGCLSALKHHVSDSGQKAMALKAVIFAFEILALTASTLLGRTIQNEKRRRLFQ